MESRTEYIIQVSDEYWESINLPKTHSTFISAYNHVCTREFVDYMKQHGFQQVRFIFGLQDSPYIMVKTDVEGRINEWTHVDFIPVKG